MADAGPLLRIILQRHSADCGIACLAMFLGKRYEDILIEVGEPVVDTGMTIKLMKQTAARLHMPLKMKRKIDLDGGTGILGVRFKDKREHVVVLHEGLIFDTDGTVWEVDDYFADGTKPTSLLVRDDSKA